MKLDLEKKNNILKIKEWSLVKRFIAICKIVKVNCICKQNKSWKNNILYSLILKKKII